MLVNTTKVIHPIDENENKCFIDDPLPFVSDR